MLEPLTQRQQDLIVNNVLRACKDIEALNKTGYNFLYLASGFIAHYNIHGFKAYYNTHSLEENILANARANMWYNFHPGNDAYEYYMSKKDVYQRILAGINYISQREYA
jgi:hypothetical protein